MRTGQEDRRDRTLSPDKVYHILSNRRRRFVFRILARREEPIDISTLAEQVAALDNDVSIEDVSYDQRKSVYTGLYQSHLSKMARAGLIRSESGWDRIELTDRGSEIKEYLIEAADDGTLGYTHYGGLIGVGIGLVAGLSLGYASPVVLPEAAHVPFIVGVLVGLVIGYAYITWSCRSSRPDSGSERIVESS